MNILQEDQLFLLACAYGYSIGEPVISDKDYDMFVRYLQRKQDSLPDYWAENSIYKDVFVHDPAWTYTSHHFPATEEVVTRYEECMSLKRGLNYGQK